MPELLIAFRGPVRCERAGAPLGLTLHGLVEPAGEARSLAFSTMAAPPDLPGTLEDVRVTRLDETHYRVAGSGREWLLEASAVHLNRAVATSFYRALPPRPVPLVKRLIWRTVLALAAGRAGLSLLRALRR